MNVTEQLNSANYTKKEDTDLPDCLSKYFTGDEFTKAVTESKKPITPSKSDNDLNSPKAGGNDTGDESDSQPSCDNFDADNL